MLSPFLGTLQDEGTIFNSNYMKVPKAIEQVNGETVCRVCRSVVVLVPKSRKKIPRANFFPYGTRSYLNEKRGR